MIRADLAAIIDWIEPGSRILDLGCGDGELLAHLSEHRKVSGYGLELDIDNIQRCVERGLNVIQADLDRGIREFAPASFDYVVMTQAIQVLQQPREMLREMLRIGRRGIVTFPNFGHWSTRLQLLLRGRMPKTKNLPAEWYDTQNIHLCTIADFEALCGELGLRIVRRAVTDQHHGGALRLRMRLHPNLSGAIGLYLLENGND